MWKAESKIKSPHLNDNAKRVAMEQDKMFATALDFMQNLPLPYIPVQEVFLL